MDTKTREKLNYSYTDNNGPIEWGTITNNKKYYRSRELKHAHTSTKWFKIGGNAIPG